MKKYTVYEVHLKNNSDTKICIYKYISHLINLHKVQFVRFCIVLMFFTLMIKENHYQQKILLSKNVYS